MHVVVKNLQSIRGESCWEDFIAELNTCNFDVLLICETWRGERDASFIMEKGHHVYLSGGASHQGVGNLHIGYFCFTNFPYVFSCLFQTDLQLTFFHGAPGGSEFSVCTFLWLGMRMVQWNKCMMC